MKQAASIRKQIDEKNKSAWQLTLEEPEKALEISKELLKLSESIQYETGKASCLLNIGWCNIYLSHNDAALSNFEDALAIFIQENDKHNQMRSLIGLGSCYHNLSRYDRAMDYYSKSLDLAREENDKERESAALNNIGEICYQVGNVKEALDYFLKAYEIIEKETDIELQTNLLANIGLAFKTSENYDQASAFTSKALTLALKTNDRISMSQCYNTLGLIAQEIASFEEAEASFKKALDICSISKNVIGKIETLQNLGSLLFLQDHSDAALQYFTEADTLCQEAASIQQRFKLYEKIADVYEKQQNFKEALQYFRAAKRYEHEIVSERTTKKLQNIQVQYETEKTRTEAEIFRLKNVELKEKTERLELAYRQIQAISTIGRCLTSQLKALDIMKTLHEQLEKYLSFTIAGIGIFDETSKKIHFEYIFENGKLMSPFSISLDVSKSYSAWCIEHKQPVIINDVQDEFSILLTQKPYTNDAGIRSLIYIPLLFENKPKGILTIQSPEIAAYDDHALQFIEALAPYIAVALENASIHQRLEVLNKELMNDKLSLEQAAEEIARLANHDNLTGLPNRRLLFELLHQAFELANRQKSLVAILFIDLDDFKPINDRLGHQAGDIALIAVAERLKNLLRTSDTIARVGGDEFVVCLSTIHSRKDVEYACKKILQECTKIIKVKDTDCIIGMSIGIAVYPEDGTTIDELLNKADSAMYKVKHEEKNGFTFF